MIQYVVGDATQPQGSDNKYIIHVCNTSGGWGRGFVLALSNRWSAPEKHYRNWYETGEMKLGQVQFVSVEETVWVVNMIAQDGYMRGGQPPLRYEALAECLGRVAETIKCHAPASVHGPRFGSGLAGGDWAKIESLIMDKLPGVPVTIYDLP